MVYAVSGATKTDILVASQVSAQLRRQTLNLVFPGRDGAYVVKATDGPDEPRAGLHWVMYGQCAKVEVDTCP